MQSFLNYAMYIPRFLIEHLIIIFIMYYMVCMYRFKKVRDDAKKTGLMSIIRDYWVKNRYFFINNLAQ